MPPPRTSAKAASRAEHGPILARSARAVDARGRLAQGRSDPSPNLSSLAKGFCSEVAGGPQCLLFSDAGACRTPMAGCRLGSNGPCATKPRAAWRVTHPAGEPAVSGEAPRCTLGVRPWLVLLGAPLCCKCALHHCTLAKSLLSGPRGAAWYGHCSSKSALRRVRAASWERFLRPSLRGCPAQIRRRRPWKCGTLRPMRCPAPRPSGCVGAWRACPLASLASLASC